MRSVHAPVSKAVGDIWHDSQFVSRQVHRLFRGRFPGNRRPLLYIFASLIFSAALSFGQTLTGTVANLTENRPGAKDDVILLKLGQGMEEAARSKTDSRGNFSFKLDDIQSPHLVRVIHQGVTYHRLAPPGTTSVEVQVYDSAQKVEGISTAADITHLQTSQGKLIVQRMFSVQNSSQPPLTEMNERSLEFYLPEGASIVQGSAMTAGGQPLALAPVAEGNSKDHLYTFIFPLRPGDTRFEVDYELPYSGASNISLRLAAPVQQFMVIVPKTMQLNPAPGSPFQAASDTDEPDAVVQMASNVAAGQLLSLQIAGQGAFPPQNADSNQESQAQSGQPDGTGTSSGNAPGGGLGPPIDAPDPLQKYRWYVLGGLAGTLIVSAVVIASRQQAAAHQASVPAASRYRESDQNEALHPRARIEQCNAVSAGGPNFLLLEGLKQEFFEVELEYQRGTISPVEYEQTRAALNQTLQRALRKREDAPEG
jgi:hypothetical protein